VRVSGIDPQGDVLFTLTLNIEVPQPNRPPTADGGEGQLVGSNTLVFLDGSGSSDPDGDELKFTWTQISGPDVRLEDSDLSISNFVSPVVTGEVRMVFTLEVMDGEYSSQATVTIDVNELIEPGGAGDPACEFSVTLVKTVNLGDDSSGPRPLTASCQVTTVESALPTDSSIAWTVDGATLAGPLSTHKSKTFSFSTAGTHTIAVALLVGGSTIGCQNAQTGELSKYVDVWPVVSGKVQDADGNGIPDVVVAANAGGSTAVTASDGTYVVHVPMGWSGILSAQHLDFDFSPDTLALSGVTRDTGGQDFVVLIPTDANPVTDCDTDAACDDGQYCNGREVCVSGLCQRGPNPCTTSLCDEAADSCFAQECTVSAECDDTLYCNGAESCSGGACVSGAPPCPLSLSCSESTDLCGPAVEGFGAVSAGGAGGEVYHVTSLADSGPGTLRDAVENRAFASDGPRIVVFDVGGSITLQSDIKVAEPFLTVDGGTAPPPGITIRKADMYDGEFIVGGTHDIILRNLRFWGVWQAGGPSDNNANTIVIDGDRGPDYHARNIVLDHVTARNATDGGPDIWGEVSDVTISWCFFFYNRHPTTVSHYPSPYMVRERISMHHNVYAKNGERHPQLRADVRTFDYVNNVIYDWGYFEGGGYGIRVRNESGEPKVNANIVNNYFLPTRASQWALVYGSQPGSDGTDNGPSTSPPQGTVVSTSSLGSLYVQGNVLPADNQDQYSTVSVPLFVPASARVTTYPADQLGSQVLPRVGMLYRDLTEQAILNELAGAMSSEPGGCSGNADCDDGWFCNGPETCSGGVCVAGTTPCTTGQTCDETGDRCVDPEPECTVNADCSDSLYCNGTERCVSGACVSGSNPCAVGMRCVEATDTCEEIVPGDWTPPIGIPMPSFGVNETTESLYGSATYATHYVNKSVACSDSNNGGKGSASAPRCTIPTSLPAGSVVELRGGPYTYGNTDWSWTHSGTVTRPVIIRGAGATMPVIQDKKVLLRDCTYLIIENIFFDDCRISGSGANQGISFRHNELRGRDGSNGMEPSGVDVVIYDNHIYDAGTWDPPDDRHGITIREGSQRVWIVDNEIHGCSGDSIQFCHGCTTAPPRFVYVGRNVLHEDIENGVDIKYASDVVISQNYLYGYRPTSSGSTSSDGSAIVLGSDGGPSRVWVLFNEVFDSDNGIRNEATNGAWIVGNVIHNIGGFGIGLEKNAPDLYIVNNTIHDVDVGISQFWRDQFRLHIYNNVFANIRGQRFANHINIESGVVSDASVLASNLCWQAGSPVKIRWDSLYTIDSTQEFSVFPGGTQNRLADPLFINAAAGDFRLSAGSQAVDTAATSINAAVYTQFKNLYGLDIYVDFDGVSRARGAAPDRGAYER
jgi:pectate lyase